MNDKAKHNFDEGTFEYIEAKIRRDVDDTSFGFDFEWLCKWFLENAPSYRDMTGRIGGGGRLPGTTIPTTAGGETRTGRSIRNRRNSWINAL